jgi:hypothetical protein
MASLGNEAYVGRLIARESVEIAGTLKTTQSVQSNHKVVGSDDKNLVQIHQTGSIFYLKWSHVEQITLFETTANSTEVVVVVIGHNVELGDVVFVDSLGGIADINGIIPEHIEGPRTVTSIGDSTIFRFNAGGPATSTGTIYGVEPLIRIDRYKFIDLATSSATWSYSTTKPIVPHTNIHTFSL